MLDVRDEEQWTCPICLDVLYKPCVNRCGHIFCFWCMHKSMNWGIGGQSRCPYCRQDYSRFPAVCESLHYFVMRQFPADYARREAAIKEEESETQRSSFLVDELPDLPEQDFHHAIFTCTTCGRVATQAAVLGCGHLVCGGTTHSQQQLCSKCNSRLYSTPSPCPRVSSLAAPMRRQKPRDGLSSCSAIDEQQLTSITEDPEIVELRELISAVCPAEIAPADPSAGNHENRGAAPQNASMHDGRADSSQASANVVDNPPADGSGEPEPQVVHYGVGCDGMSCGMCPIIGRRYRCTDCPEAIGFDLCGQCYDHSLKYPNPKGRYNQSHRPDHRMELIQGGLPLALEEQIRGLMGSVNATALAGQPDNPIALSGAAIRDFMIEELALLRQRHAAARAEMRDLGVQSQDAATQALDQGLSSQQGALEESEDAGADAEDGEES